MSLPKLVFAITFSVLVSNNFAQEKTKAETKFDAKTLIGVWNYTAGERDGDKVDVSKYKDTVDITKESFTLNGEMKFVMKYEIDATKKPVAIKFTITESPFGAGAEASGIIEIKGDELKLCYAPMGGEAPTEFKAASGSGFHQFALKRKSEKLDASKLIGNWKYVSGNRDGASLDADHFNGESVVITKEAFKLKGEVEFVMEYKLDAKNAPANVDFTISEGPFAIGSKAPGIIKMSNDQLHVCYASMGGARPKGFKPANGSGEFMFVLKKTAKK